MKEAPQPILAEFLPPNAGPDRFAALDRIDLPTDQEILQDKLKPFIPHVVAITSLGLIAAAPLEKDFIGPDKLPKYIGTLCAFIALAKEVGEDKSIRNWPEIVLNGAAGYLFGSSLTKGIQSIPKDDVLSLELFPALGEFLLAGVGLDYMRRTTNSLKSWTSWPGKLAQKAKENKQQRVEENIQAEKQRILARIKKRGGYATSLEQEALRKIEERQQSHANNF
jgi:hypothetical protein